MKTIFLVIALTFLFSCKKEKPPVKTEQTPRAPDKGPKVAI